MYRRKVRDEIWGQLDRLFNKDQYKSKIMDYVVGEGKAYQSKEQVTQHRSEYEIQLEREKARIRKNNERIRKMEEIEGELLDRIHDTRSKRSEAMSKLKQAMSGSTRPKKNFSVAKIEENVVNLNFDKNSQKELDTQSKMKICS